MRHGLAIVIRVAGERTAEACRRLAAAELDGGPVIIVKESPFERALTASFERAIEAGHEWTLVLDGDVLLRPGTAARLLAQSRRMPPHVFQFQGLVCDKLLGAARKAGNRVYRTSQLAVALAHIPSAGTELRPETHVCRRMERHGHVSRLVDVIVGLHDYEQFHVDIYRKAHVFAQKHVSLAARLLLTWAGRARDDADFLTAIRGFCNGLETGFRGIDVRAYPGSLQEACGAGFEEKPPLNAAEWSPAAVDRIVAAILSPAGPQVGWRGRHWARVLRTMVKGPHEYPLTILSPGSTKAICIESEGSGRRRPHSSWPSTAS
jgi:hypothetical protein